MARSQEEEFGIGAYSYSEPVPGYADIGVLRAFLEGKNESPEAAFVCSVVEIMTELRFEAEKLFREKKTLALNKRGELLINVGDIAEKLTRKDGENPPEQLISLIANQHIGQIKELVARMRKVLHRKRDMVSIGEAQQLDSHCLRWLAVQPGRNAVEKAGCRQRLLAIVREETHNTLENRVLKDFAIRGEILARRYLRQFAARFPNSARIAEVRSLQRFLYGALKLPQMQSLRRPMGGVQANYVLLQDTGYNKMWELYRLMLAQTRMSEMVWEFRHRLFAELFCLWIITRLNIDDYKAVFKSSFWINIMPDEGSFFVKPSFLNAFEKNGRLISLRVKSDYSEMIVHNSNQQYVIRLLYVPELAENELTFSNKGIIYVVCCFSKLCGERSQLNDNVIWVDSLLDMDEAVTNIMHRCRV